MSYTTLSNVLASFPPALTAVGVGSFNVTTNQVNSYYIPAAASVVDAMIAQQYTTPVNSAPFILTKLTTDLVIYELLRDRGMRIPDFINDRYTQAMDMLKMMAAGKMKVPGAVENPTGDNEAFSTGQGFHSIFSPVLRDTEQGVDPDFYEQERNKRLTPWLDIP